MKIHDELMEAKAQITRALLEKDRQIAGAKGDTRWIHTCIVRGREALERAEKHVREQRSAERIKAFRAGDDLPDLPHRRTQGFDPEKRNRA